MTTIAHPLLHALFAELQHDALEINFYNILFKKKHKLTHARSYKHTTIGKRYLYLVIMLSFIVDCDATKMHSTTNQSIHCYRFIKLAIHKRCLSSLQCH